MLFNHRFPQIIFGALLAFCLSLVAGCSASNNDKTTLMALLVSPAYTVTYDMNGAGSGIIPEDTASYRQGSQVTVLPNTGALAKTGYTFVGWNTVWDMSGDEYDASGSATFTMKSSNVTLYAMWTNDALEAVQKRDMATIPAGTYTQQTEYNADDDVSDDGESFSYTNAAFLIARYEVTYELYYTVCQWAITNEYNFANAGTEGNDGTAGNAPTTAKYEPVTTVNWRDAMVWSNAYSQMAGFSPVYKNSSNVAIIDSRDTNGTECDAAVPDPNSNGYRLPTESEWQYAASYKDGLSWTPWNYASGDSDVYYSSTTIGDYAWYNANPGGATQDVGIKLPNAIGLYDMSGNVWEWCFSLHPNHSDYWGRVMRGGSWTNPYNPLKIGYASKGYPNYEYNYRGFRVARTIK